ncbi:hypothetical protein [Paenibacillus sp. GYB003]|uniref:hypothetical protein n=1 Tax=Paenibacillus sp. GYB003 TaxID=2994392 RepID=UPI002F9610DC
MKRTIIGGILTFTGCSICLSILIVAALYVPNITSWSGSKLWFAIFGAKRYGNEVVQSLFLGFPFFAGLLLFAVGLVILAIQYFEKE